MQLDREIIERIKSLAEQTRDIKKVVLFGSRAREDASKTSDIDLAVYGSTQLQEFIYDLESKVPTLLMFDVSNMEEIEDSFFIEQVEKEGVTIYEKP